MSKTRVEATQEKIELLQRVKRLIHNFRKEAAAIEEQIDTMVDADLTSMEAEKQIIDTMANIIKDEDKQEGRATKGA